MLEHLRSEMAELDFKVVIVDESHKLRVRLRAQGTGWMLWLWLWLLCSGPCCI